MNIYSSTTYIENPHVGDLQLEVNSILDFKARDICFQDIPRSLGNGANVISYDVKRCTEVLKAKIKDGPIVIRSTKWQQAEITPEIVKYLEDQGYIIATNYRNL